MTVGCEEENMRTGREACPSKSLVPLDDAIMVLHVTTSLNATM